MAIERRPRTEPRFPPTGGIARRVRRDETLVSIAREIATAQRRAFAWQDLAQFNFGTRDTAEVNWCLSRYVGCHHEVGDNYIFSNDDIPGIIYTPPAQSPVPDPPPARPNPPRPRPHPVVRDARDQCTNTICRACPRIEEYIAAVVKAERIYPNLASNPANMVTALRKTWNWGTYAGWATWGQMLPNATAAALDVEATPDQRSPAAPGRPRGPATMRGRGGFSETERWLLRGIDCLQTPQHVCTDFGHVLAAIDATNFPGTRVPFLNSHAKVIAGCSWAGDLGSAYRAFMGWCVSHDVDPRDELALVSKFDSSGVWDLWCGRADLLGDVDGVVLGRTFSRGQAFSRQLQTYYAVGHTQASIFSAFPNVHATSTSNIVDLTWAWVQARTLGTCGRFDAVLQELARRFQRFVRDGQAGRIQNRCDSVRQQPVRRPSTTAAPAPAR